MDFKYYERYGCGILNWRSLVLANLSCESRKLYMRLTHKYFVDWNIFDKIKVFICGQLSMTKVEFFYK